MAPLKLCVHVIRMLSIVYREMYIKKHNYHDKCHSTLQVVIKV